MIVKNIHKPILTSFDQIVSNTYQRGIRIDPNQKSLTETMVLFVGKVR